MAYIILDFEWNQPGRGGTIVINGRAVEGEIVQIGAVKVENGKLTDRTRISVRPEYYEDIDQYVGQFTGLTQQDLWFGLSFPQAMEKFLEWSGEGAVFFTWSDNDHRVLEENYLLYELDMAACPGPFYDLQWIYGQQIRQDTGRQCGLEDALAEVGEEGQTAHDALHDAYNTYLVSRHLDLEKGLEELKERLSHADPLTSKVPILEMTAHGMNMRDALNDPELNGFFCPDCGRWVGAGKWVFVNSRKRVALAGCSCGSRFFLRLNRTKSGRVSRRVYDLSEDLEKYYKETEEQAEIYFAKREEERRKKSQAMSQTASGVSGNVDKV